MVAIVIVKNMHISIRSSNVQVTTQDEGIIDFQPGFDNAAQSAIVTGIACVVSRFLFYKILLTPVSGVGGLRLLLQSKV